jgi:catechol 2,3-dioxygenase-like lactoylglutathione lyase family enzyme
VIDPSRKFDVGGVLLAQPFKVRRLGHVGLNLTNFDEARQFYSNLLGFIVSDTIDFSARASDPTEIAGLGDPKGYFMRYGSDHHSFVLFNRRVRETLDKKRRFRPGITINQITWQVGSMLEVAEAIRWFSDTGVEIQRVGRDMPGSNWHAYVYDPDGHTNELYYGIEQIGWSGYSKPAAMYDRGFEEAPAIPQIAEYQEVNDALSRGVDLTSGTRNVETEAARFNVDGIMLPRPFKIVRLGPVRLFVDDLEVARRFYVDTLGFSVTEDVAWNGHHGVYLRANTEHHSMALFQRQLKDELALSTNDTTVMSIGLQVATYRQLRDAARFLAENGATLVDVPEELHPGIDYAIHVLDPDGHVIELYFSMEQIGWDGHPRPAGRTKVGPESSWPDVLQPTSDSYRGEPFLGPWQ